MVNHPRIANMRCITAVACAALALAALSGGAEARVGEQSPAAWAHPFARHKVGERQLSLDDDPYSTYCPDYLCGPGEYCASEGFTFYCECHISYAVTLLAGLVRCVAAIYASPGGGRAAAAAGLRAAPATLTLAWIPARFPACRRRCAFPSTTGACSAWAS